jgi:RimJ/RimL family protein N-acetyltransferase
LDFDPEGPAIAGGEDKDLGMTNEVSLREVHQGDLPIFFEHQLDPEATRMAAFPSRDHDAFMAHWQKIIADEKTIVRTITFRTEVAGNIVSWEQSGERNVGYWLGRKYWGKGIASEALSQFLELVSVRPLYAGVARHNTASIRVLQKCGFTITGEDRFAGPDGDEGEEYILILGASGLE